ncbi:MAG TPA: hypothetical protein VMU42_04275 [Candidatus Sulfotelmatobacter sp.]|nr:hypothetical protein [Candidatus Sulfotelmatobacter sp.]
MMRRAKLCAWGLGLLALTAAPALAEDFVVVESSAPTIAAGAQIASGSAVTVPDKARVVLLAASGQIVTLNGPFQGVPAATGGAGGDSRLLTAVASLVHANTQESGSVGAVRAADVQWRAATIKAPHDVFAIDASDGGDACLDDPEHAMLTRNPSDPAGSMTIHAMDGDATAKVEWPASTARMPWPKELKLADGATYVIEPPGQASAAMTTVHLLPAAPAQSDIERVKQLTDAGCTDQAKLLLGVIIKAAQK